MALDIVNYFSELPIIQVAMEKIVEFLNSVLNIGLSALIIIVVTIFFALVLLLFYFPVKYREYITQSIKMINDIKTSINRKLGF